MNQVLARPVAPEDTPLTVVGTRLRAARVARGLSQEALAAPEFTKSYVSAVERGKARPSLKALDLLAQRLGIPLTALLAIEAGSPPLLSQLDQIERLLYVGQPAAAQPLLAALADDPTAVPTAVPVVQDRFYYLQGLTLRRLGAFGAAVGAFQTALALVSAESLAGLSLRDALGETYFAQHARLLALEHHQACWQTLQTLADVPALLRLRVASHLAQDYAEVDQDEAVLALVQTLQPHLDRLLALETQAAAWPAMRAPPTGADGPDAPALALYAVASTLAYAVRLLIEGARAAARQGQLPTAHTWCHQARMYVAGLGQQPVLVSEVATLQATLALATHDMAAATAALTTALADLEAYGGLLPGAAIPLDLPPAYTQTLIVAGQLAAQQGWSEQVEQRFGQAFAWAAVGDPALTRWVAREYAEILQAQGATEQANQYYRQACQVGGHPRPGILAGG